MSEAVWIIVAGDEVGVPKRWWTGAEWSEKPKEAREYDRAELQDVGHRLLQRGTWPWIRALKHEVAK